MDCTGTPTKYWLLCLLFVCFLMNCLVTHVLNWETPLLVRNSIFPLSYNSIGLKPSATLENTTNTPTTAKSPRRNVVGLVLLRIKVIPLPTGSSQMIPIKSLLALLYTLLLTLTTPIHMLITCLHLVGVGISFSFRFQIYMRA